MKKGLVAAVLTLLLIHTSLNIKEPEPAEENRKAETNQSTEIAEEEKIYPSEDFLEEEFYYDSLELLAIMVEAEAGNQNEEGKKLVVDVVLNRVDSEQFPDSIWEVITQINAFSSLNDGGMDRVYEPSESTFKATREELENRTNSEVLYFSAEDFSEYGTPWKKVGDHYFSTK